MEVDKVVGLDSLDYEILEDLDYEMEELDLKNLDSDNWDLDCLASYVGLPYFSN